MTSTFVTRLVEHRARQGLSQAELAQRAGVSRQTVNAIEAGRAKPKLEVAMRLAAVLGVTIEALFELRQRTAQVSLARLGTSGGRSATRVAVGEVNGRRIAHPLSSRDSAGLLTAADGLLRRGTKRSAQVELFGRELPAAVFVAGCDPALGVLSTLLPASRCRVVWIPANSTQALEAFERAEVHVAGTHLASAARPGTATIRLARWQIGLAVAAGNPLRIRRAQDLVRTRARVASREPGSGAHAALADALGAEAKRLQTLPKVASGHFEVAALVAAGAADAGVTLHSAALAHGLSFIPLREEAFDLVVARRDLEAGGPVAPMIDAMTSGAFRRQLHSLGGYELRDTGRVLSA